MDTRARLIDIAAYLDRVERNGGGDDFRHQCLLEALPLLSDASCSGGRARAVLEHFSDQSEAPVDRAAVSFAHGAPQSSTI